MQYRTKGVGKAADLMYEGDLEANALKELGIKTLKDEPKNVKVALLCVRHKQFEDFFKKFDGVLYDYKKCNWS